MRIGKIIVSLFLCIAGGLSYAGIDDGLMFYCNYDGSADAVFSVGDKTAKYAVTPEFQAGVRGQALVIGGIPKDKQNIEGGVPKQSQIARNCYYSPDKNINIEKGTISFWVNPIDWDGNTKGFNILFYTLAGRNSFQIYKFWSGGKLFFLRGEQDKWTIIQNSLRAWKTGQWHHIAVTWSKEELKMFIDGFVAGSEKVSSPFENIAPVEPLSVGPGGAWSKAFTGRSLVDEFRIYDRPLKHDEVISLYIKDSVNAEVDSDLITIGEKTPEFNGKLSGYQYSFECNLGFSNLKGILSKHHSSYFLSYDRNNLYIGLSSEAPSNNNKDADLKKTDRAEFFIITEKNPETVYRFALTPAGAVYETKKNGEDWKLSELKIKSTVNGKNWILETAIPFSRFGLENAPDGQTWKINIARVFASTQEEISASQVVGSVSDESHFMKLKFSPDAPAIKLGGWMHTSAKSQNADLEIKYNFFQKTDKAQEELERVSSIILFSKGKSTPSIHSASQNHETGFYQREYIIEEKLNEKSSRLCRIRNIYSEYFPLTVSFIYVQDKKRLFVSAKRDADGKIQLRFLRPDQTCALQLIQDLPKDSNYFNALFDLDYTKLTPDEYNIKVDYIAPDGKAVEVWEQPCLIPGKDSFETRKYIDIDADKVPAPWTPLKTDADKICMWGRTYDFSKGFLFSSLVSQGQEFLAAPAELRMNGEALAVSKTSKVEKISENDVLAEWRKSTDFGNIKVTNDIKTHFDGYCEISMSLTPEGGAQEIKSLSFDIPIKSDMAALVSDNRISYLDGSKSGAVGDYWKQSASSLCLWVGNEKIGLNWVAPDLKDWFFKDASKNIEIIRKGDVTVLRFNLIDAPLKLENPKIIKFGFVLTPSRPLNQKILRLREQKEYEMWCQPWKYFSTPDYDTADRKIIEETGKNVKEEFLYLSSVFISPCHPAWTFYEEEWRQLSSRRSYGQWVNDFSDIKNRSRFSYVSHPCTGSKTYINFLQNTWAEYFRKAKIPLTPKSGNYYFDDFRIPGTCDNSRHGCAKWKGVNGKPNVSILINESRELSINVYRMIKRTAPGADAKIYVHNGWTRFMPTQHFAEIICGGEAVEDIVSADKGYFKVLTPEKFRALFNPQTWGLKTVFINMLARKMNAEQKAKFRLDNPVDRYGMLHIYGYCVVHDVDMGSGLPVINKMLWAAQDKIGWDENVKFFPYWENDAVKLVSPKSSRILASAYTNNGKMLLAILNDTDKEETVKLDFDFAKLGVKSGLKGTDIWTAGSSCVLSNSLEEKIGPRDFKLIVFDKAE